MSKIQEKSCGIIPVYKKDNGELMFLILQNAKGGNWSFPKGHMEGEETELETAKRELLEETGISEVELIPELRYIENYEIRKYGNGSLIDKTVVIFVGFVKNQKVLPQIKEVASYKWATYEEAMKTFNFDNPRRILKELIKDLKKIGML